MIHMLSSFDLKPDQDFADFAADYASFLEDLRTADMIVDAGPLGRRVHNTPMDTYDNHSQVYFSVMSFRDREQLDAAYAHIEQRTRPGAASHLSMYCRLTKSVFLCWEDMNDEKEK